MIALVARIIIGATSVSAPFEALFCEPTSPPTLRGYSETVLYTCSSTEVMEMPCPQVTLKQVLFYSALLQ